jgi:hypothetical protein|nr:MAG TPA: hypothetical protein [Caudoviricetes sp.]
MAKRMTKQQFMKKWEKAVKNNSYIFLQDKYNMKKAQKYFGLSDEKVTIVGNVAKASYQIENKKKIVNQRKTKIRDSLLKDGSVDQNDIKKIVNNDRLYKKINTKNVRSSVNKAIQTEFFNIVSNIGLFKDNGAFRRALKGNDARIKEFEKKVIEAIQKSDKPFELLLSFSERIDKAFELIYEAYPEGALNSVQGPRVVNKFIDIIETELLRSV